MLATKLWLTVLTVKATHCPYIDINAKIQDFLSLLAHLALLFGASSVTKCLSIRIATEGERAISRYACILPRYKSKYIKSIYRLGVGIRDSD